MRSVDEEAFESVHLADYPVAEEEKIDEELALDTRVTMRTVGLGRAARSQAGVKVRQPLAELLVRVRSKAERRGLGVEMDALFE